MHGRLLLLAFLTGVVAVSAIARGQKAPSTTEPAEGVCHHSGSELWEGLRVLPVQFIGFKGDAVVWRYEDDHTARLGVFAINDGTQYVSQEQKRVSRPYLAERRDAVWLCYYCSRCHTLLIAHEMKPGLPPVD